MPNWVTNTMTVTGPKDDLRSFIIKAATPHDGDESVLSFLNFIAPASPADIEGEKWYNWNVNNWGTKWDACRPRMKQVIDGGAVYVFDTAWDLPLPVFVKMVEDFPTLTFEIRCLEEQGWGMEFLGENGILQTTDEWDIPETHEESEKVYGEGKCEGCFWAKEEDDPLFLLEGCPR